MKLTVNLISWGPFILYLFTSTFAMAQQPRVIREAAFGVEFTAPDGWTYQRNEIGYIMGHKSIPGVIIVSTLPYKNIEEMRQGAYEGVREDGGTVLQISGEPKAFGNNGLSANYTGTMNWEKVTAYSVGLISPFEGPGLNCMIITIPDRFGNEHIAALESLARSVKFFKPEIPDAVKEWDDWFKTPGGCRLKYMKVSSSTSYSSGYAGGSSEETIDLCPNGSFGFSSSSEYSMSIDAGSAYSSSGDNGQGKWELKFNGTNPVLILNFNDGRVMEFELTYVNRKTYLNGARYFVLFNKEGPQCY